MLQKLQEIEQRYQDLDAEFNDPSIVSRPKDMQRIGKARAALEPIAATIRDYKLATQNVQELEEALNDPELRELAEAEIESARAQVADLEQKLKLMLAPKDPNDDRAVIMEIRPAAGGEEASLFAGELLRLYLRYAERRKWKVELVEVEETGLKGISRATFNINADGAYSQLKHESGVHRVQRVPATESQGRIHTSTVTVSVLPEADEVEVDIKAEDIEVSTFCSSSAGGQHMQKNETAIRIIHKPTGIVVTCQDERSQQQNKLKAMAVLRAKLYQREQERLASERSGAIKGQVGSGDRSEKIRTYNFPQSRITDHRIGFQENNINAFMDGDIQELIDALIQAEQAKRLADGDQAA